MEPMEPNASANAVRHKATKRKQISLKDKLDIIEQVEKGKKQVDVAVAYGLSKQTVSTIINAKEAVLAKKVSGDLQPKRFRLRKASYPNVEEALLMWLRDARSRNIPVNGLLLRKRAEQLAVVLNQEQFQCSEGWLSRFKSRHAIAFKCLSGESASVDDTVVADWIADVLPAHLEGYAPRDVFNADESGIFYKLKPGKTFCFGDDTCHGGKKSKERISVLFCCNMDGSEKEKLLVIGKSRRPRCMRNMHVPVDWHSNKSAWMTKDIFNKWLLDFDSKMVKQKRNVILFLDNCSSHMQLPGLHATKVAYFPPNTTSKAQPIDQGIVHSVKSRYRSRLAERLLFDMQQKRDSVIDLKFAVQVLSTVWAQIQPGIVKNCFRKAGFRVDSDCTDCLPQEDQPDPGVWSAVEEAFGSQQFSDYVTADDDLVSSEQLTDEEIVAQIRQVPNAEQEEEQNEEGNSGIVTEEVTTSQALDYIQGLKNYFEQQATTSDEMNTLVMMETRIVSKAVRHTVQAKLTSFFQNI